MNEMRPEEADTKEGRPVGRPSLYEPRFAGEIIEHCRSGASLASFASSIGVSRATLNVWASAHPEFLDALQRARDAALVWWEGCARRVAVAGGGPGTATVVTFALRNLGVEDYRDRREPPIKVKLPEVTSAQGAAKAIAEALRAYGAGEIEAAQAETIAGLARSYLSASEIADFEARLDALERKGTNS